MGSEQHPDIISIGPDDFFVAQSIPIPKDELEITSNKWERYAQCGANAQLGELLFSDSKRDQEVAVKICRSCQVASFCLAGAIERREESGVWGGHVFPLKARIKKML